MNNDCLKNKKMKRVFSERTIEQFNEALRLALSGADTCTTISADDVKNILSLARSQDVFQLACYGIIKQGFSVPAEEELYTASGIYLYKQNEYLLEKTRQVLDSEHIPYVPLKGAVIKELYPKPWMRSSCDVDILVHEENIERAIDALVKGGFVTDGKREYHDISLYYGGFHLELHFNICENIPRIDNVLERVWKYVHLKTGYEYRENNAFLMFHILAHMLYHFLKGGSNIKQFVDIWLMRKNELFTEEELLPFLQECRLERFYGVICEVTDIWFEGKTPTGLSTRIEKQIISGGVAGGRVNTDKVNIFIDGGRNKHILHLAFLPFREMQWIYPELRKYPFLLPYYYCKRVLSKTIGKERNRAKEIMQADTNGSDASEELDLLDKMGLH